MNRLGNPLFTKGNQLGKRQTPHPGAGRPKDWFKKRCDEILSKRRLFEFLGRIASGEGNRKSKIDGRLVELSPTFSDQIRAITELSDIAYGRPSQHVDVTNDQALTELLATVSLLIKQKVPSVCGHCKKELGIREALARGFQEIGARFATKGEPVRISSTGCT